MGDAYPDGAVDAVIFKLADQGRLGRKTKAGFYDYDDAGKRQASGPASHPNGPRPTPSPT